MRAWLALPAACVACVGCAVVISGCATAGGPGMQTTRGTAQPVVRGPGWTVNLPAGWQWSTFHAASDRLIASSGDQISNVSLPNPSLVAGFPIQVSNRVLPSGGIGMIIVTDTDPKVSVPTGTLPLPTASGASRRWVIGSALGGEPYLEVAGFRTAGKNFIVTAKIAPGVSPAELRALDWIVTSIRSTG